MIPKLLIALLLMAVCVVLHAAAVASAMRWLEGNRPPIPLFLSRTAMFIRLAGWMILFHLLEVTAWAATYTWLGAMPDLQTALYFSGVTYTTTGYGDLVLPADWRLVGGVEALTGILLCGWSTGFFFAVVSQLYEADREMGRLKR